VWCSPNVHPWLRGPVERLWKLLRPLEQPSQLIHGDISGNILFATHLEPVVIDFSPYWRPAGFAAAVLIADATVWEGGGP
jgi:fructosamine-3-kinase